MKKILYGLLILFCSTSYAQETVKIKDKVSKYEKYEYYVLASDKKTKHGSYKKFSGKDLEVSGFYKSGVKDSVWTDYYYNGKTETTTTYKNDKKNGEFNEYSSDGKLTTKGFYAEDTMSGIWEYYNKGKLDRIYDYATNRFTYLDEEYDLNYTEIKDGDTTHHKLDQPCMYINGLWNLYSDISRNFRYTEAAKNKNIQGKIFVSFVVGKDGRLKEIKILRGLGYGLDEMAIEAIKALPGKWSPAVKNGEAIEIQFTIPIVCKLG